MDTPVTSPPARRSAGLAVPSNAGPGELDQFSHALLSAMLSFKQGDFSVRLPSALTGVDGKIADAFNDIVLLSERRARETSLVTHAVGREGKLKQRMNVAGAMGGWADEVAAINTLIDDLVWPTTEVTRAVGAVAKGDLGQSMALEVDGRPLEGEFLRSARLVNNMIDQLSVFTSEVTRVAREVGTEGKLGGQAQVRGVSGVWKELTESVNQMAGNLTAQVRNIADVTIAVANGDLSKKITVDVRGEILQLKEAINTMVDQLRGFAAEVTRVAREVGTDGKLGGQAVVPGVAGTWKDLTDSVNAMASNLTAQVRNIAGVTTAVARGDLSRKITVDVKGEILELKDTVNTMVDQLNAFASEVSRVAREVGTEGKLGGRAEVPDVAGTWKDLTDSVNAMGANLTAQVRNIAEVTTAVARGDLSRKITVDVKGEILELKDTINTMVDQLNGFASEVTRVAREVGTEGKLGGQAAVPGRRRHVEEPHRLGQLDGQQPDRPGAQHRLRRDLDRARRLVEQDHGRRQGRDSRAQGHHQYDGRSAERLRVGSQPRRARGRHRGQAGRAGRGPRRRRHVEGPHRQRELDGQQPDRPGAQHRRRRHRHRQGRSVAQDHGRRQGRDPAAEEHHQHDGRSAERVRLGSEPRGARGRHRRQARRPGRGARRRRHVEGPHRQRELDGVEPDRPGAQHRRRGDGHRQRGSLAQDHGRRQGRDSRAEEHHQHDGRSAQLVRLRGHARGARGRHRGTARRRSRRAGRRRHVEGPHRLGQRHGREPHRPGAQHRRGHDGGRPRRPVAQDHGRRQGRDPRAEEHDQHDGRPAARVRGRSHPRGARGRHRGPAGRPGRSASASPARGRT